MNSRIQGPRIMRTLFAALEVRLYLSGVIPHGTNRLPQLVLADPELLGQSRTS